MRTRLATLASSAVLVPAVLTLGATPALAAGNSPSGNNGTVKIADLTDVATPSNDPHVSCSFAVEWYGFDKGDLYSDVTFESQAPTADAKIAVQGSTHVFVGEDAAGGATDLDARVVYTLTFSGAAQAQQGYHVKMTTATGGSRGADDKSKVFWVIPCGGTDETGAGQPVTTDPGTTPTQPTEPVTTPTQPTEPVTTPTQPTEPVTTPTQPTEPSQPVTTTPGATAAVLPWDWNWTYATPTCDSLDVDYPSNIPDGQANDVNVRLSTNLGPLSLNFHNNGGMWGGHTTFSYRAHAQWPAGVTAYDVQWVQVGGTNYHWQGDVACGAAAAGSGSTGGTTGGSTADDQSTTPLATPLATAVSFRAGSLLVKRGASPRATVVTVANAEADVVSLQQLARGSWRRTSNARINDAGQATVRLPRLTKRGTYKFRVLVAGSAGTTGAVSKPLTVKVR